MSHQHWDHWSWLSLQSCIGAGLNGMATTDVSVRPGPVHADSGTIVGLQSCSVFILSRAACCHCRHWDGTERVLTTYESLAHTHTWTHGKPRHRTSSSSIQTGPLGICSCCFWGWQCSLSSIVWGVGVTSHIRHIRMGCCVTPWHDSDTARDKLAGSQDYVSSLPNISKASLLKAVY